MSKSRVITPKVPHYVAPWSLTIVTTCDRSHLGNVPRTPHVCGKTAVECRDPMQLVLEKRLLDAV